ncbi:hypothetical protein A5N15_03535 [Rothia kristinae]|uniref:Uncharacterized protein n=1 Tax=Rothia kristinae TaxID=37923 RepID=A0A657IVI8_9MICC|nr:hypothetical protein A5N15_03535 [Rothia kristinae]
MLLFAVFFHRWLPEARWTLVHLVALGLIANSILIWSQHFAEALLKHRLPDSARPAQLRRIRTLNLGVVVLIAGMMLTPYPAVHVPACSAGRCWVGRGVAWHAASLGRQLRAALRLASRSRSGGTSPRRGCCRWARCWGRCSASPISARPGTPGSSWLTRR